MEKEVIIFISVLLGAIAAYITARVTSNNQLRIAQENTQKELKLQSNLIRDERLKSEVTMKRNKLEELHIILSKVALENSQTVSFIQSDEDMPLSVFRERYLENCSHLHIAKSISALFYPEMTEQVSEIYNHSNIFWGAQEGVLRTDIKENKTGWEGHLGKVVASSQKISKRVNTLQSDIVNHGKTLNKAINSDI